MTSAGIDRQELNVILLGPPGAGKGTQAVNLGARYELPLIATGDMLREQVKRGSDLGRRAAAFMDDGELVRDELILEMVDERLGQADARVGFVLDGFPRTVKQAVALETKLRDAGRRSAGCCGASMPPPSLRGSPTTSRWRWRRRH